MAREILFGAIILAKDAEAVIKGTPQIVAMIEEIKNAKLSSVYSPTEYDLKRLYEELLYTLDKELPKNIRVPLKHLPFDSRKTQLISQAEQLIKGQRVRFDAFFPTTGFANLNDFKNAVSHFNDLGSKLSWWVPKVGFQNQRLTGNSQALYFPQYRDQMEALMSGVKYSVYRNYDDELKPQYGKRP